ncbi:hypothetical protein Lbir_1323 [Legionella birminghamensis]|uniref:Uncharacterized protein n=1 Tax=Legionella birminghamensis TaxID=28083 RepID=A0A378IAS5_9GAMM|nr:hypothetical protein [Legionella birminghamensis]KTC72548.1 hypothetical protein Lbir_1323 [Legionella birminghamensis]STX32143.1 Uncharacterised protein [Legionella birminghamensis]
MALDAFDTNNPTAQQAAKVYRAYLNSTGFLQLGLPNSQTYLFEDEKLQIQSHRHSF